MKKTFRLEEDMLLAGGHEGNSRERCQKNLKSRPNPRYRLNHLYLSEAV